MEIVTKPAMQLLWSMMDFKPKKLFSLAHEKKYSPLIIILVLYLFKFFQYFPWFILWLLFFKYKALNVFTEPVFEGTLSSFHTSISEALK